MKTMRKGQRSGPCVENLKRVSALFDALKRAGKRGVHLSALLERANARLEMQNQIRDLPYLHFLLFGRAKQGTGTLVGGYLSQIVEPVPGMPRNARFIRLRPGVRKREFIRHLRADGAS